MNNAFIFDMDGVIIDSERIWAGHEKKFHESLFGKKIAEKIGSSVGMSLPYIYSLALENGFSMDREKFYNLYHQKAELVYKDAPIVTGFADLIEKLRALHCKIGLVSASPENWILLTLTKTNLRHTFNYILSLHEREDLQHKPAPDGYLEAMEKLGSDPRHTIILEDSNRGIQSAKESGAFTIGFRQFLVADYPQTGADVYANTIEDVIKIVENRFIK